MVALETFVNVISLGITFVRIHLVGQAFYQNATLDKATRSMCMYSRVFSLNLKNCLIQTPKRTLPNPKTHRIKPRLIITILLNRIFFGFIKFSSKFYFVKNFDLLNFGFSIKKRISRQKWHFSF